MNSPPRHEALKQGLEALYRRFDRSMLSPDPLECVPRAGEFRDVELSAFLAALFAYGRADLIVRNVSGILAELGPRPHAALMQGEYQERFKGWKYRFHKRADLLWLLDRLRAIYAGHGTLENAFCAAPGDMAARLAAFAGLFHGGKKPSAAKSFLVPSPANGSACKRMNLFLRWMVRKDDVDIGLWTRISPAELIMPLDVHVNRIAGRLGLANPKGAANLKKALALTERFREFDAADPVRYDFALCSLGKLGHCEKTPDPASCLACVLRECCAEK